MFTAFVKFEAKRHFRIERRRGALLTQFGNQLHHDALAGNGPAHLEGQIIVEHLTVELGLQDI